MAALTAENEKLRQSLHEYQAASKVGNARVAELMQEVARLEAAKLEGCQGGGGGHMFVSWFDTRFEETVKHLHSLAKAWKKLSLVAELCPIYPTREAREPVEELRCKASVRSVLSCTELVDVVRR